jgi:hypothetical protein
MKKIQILGIALVALFAFSAISASLASAETTLLAEFLLNGAAITTTVATEGSGELILEDNKAGLGVTCSGILDGNVSADGKDEVTAVLSLAGVAVTLAAPLLCKSHKFCEESATDIEASPENLPFKTQLELTEAGAFRDIVTSASYFTACLVLGIKVSEECTTVNGSYVVKNVAAGVEAVGAVTPNGTCTTGGANAGELTFVAGNLLKPTAGGTLSVSSE